MERFLNEGLKEDASYSCEDKVVIPGLTDGEEPLARMEWGPQVGRYVVANRDIPRGATVLRSSCYSCCVIEGQKEFTCATCLVQATGHGAHPFSCKKCDKVYFCSEECQAASSHKGEECKCIRFLGKKDEVRDPVGQDQVLLTSLTALKMHREGEAWSLVDTLTTTGAVGASRTIQDRWDQLLVVVQSAVKKETTQP